MVSALEGFHCVSMSFTNAHIAIEQVGMIAFLSYEIAFLISGHPSAADKSVMLVEICPGHWATL